MIRDSIICLTQDKKNTRNKHTFQVFNSDMKYLFKIPPAVLNLSCRSDSLTSVCLEDVVFILAQAHMVVRVSILLGRST